LAEPAVHARRAQKADLRAEVGVAGQALLAAAARLRGIHRDQRAVRQTERLARPARYLRRHLVAGHQAVPEPRRPDAPLAVAVRAEPQHPTGATRPPPPARRGTRLRQPFVQARVAPAMDLAPFHAQTLQSTTATSPHTPPDGGRRVSTSSPAAASRSVCL